METKLFEILDEGTFIPVMATYMVPKSIEGLRMMRNFESMLQIPTAIKPSITLGREAYLLMRAGYSPSGHPQLIWLSYMHRNYGKPWCTYTPTDWEGRTMQEAHKYITNHWHCLKSGDVIDVQFILGETKRPKLSEELTDPTSPEIMEMIHGSTKPESATDP